MDRVLNRCDSGGEAPVCYHSGDLGDIIYSLLFCRVECGEIHLRLGPSTQWTLRAQMDKRLYSFLEPLLKVQPWIRSTQFCAQAPSCDYDLNDFRHTWFGHHSSQRLFECYAEHFKTSPLPEDRAWLSAHPAARKYPIIIARSTRYRDPSFPWRLVSAKYAGQIGFVGVPSEFEQWRLAYGEGADYLPVPNFLDLARMIAGAKYFIGNQSFPLSLAMALNTPVVQETCPNLADCLFRRPNAYYFMKGEIYNYGRDMQSARTQNAREFLQTLLPG